MSFGRDPHTPGGQYPAGLSGQLSFGAPGDDLQFDPMVISHPNASGHHSPMQQNVDPELFEILQQASGFGSSSMPMDARHNPGFSMFSDSLGGMRGAQPSMFMQDMLSMPMMPPVEVGQLPPLEPPQSPFAFGVGSSSSAANSTPSSQAATTFFGGAGAVIPKTEPVTTQPVIAEKPTRRYTKHPRKAAAAAAVPAPPASAAPNSDAQSADGGDGSGDGDEPDGERLHKRLARKAELARESRRRKKLYVHDLEEKVKQLAQKVDEMQRKHSKNPAPNNEEKERTDNQARIRQRLAELIEVKKLDDAGLQQLTALIRRFVENSRQRQAKIDYHLERAAECLVPGLQVKFTLWGLDQPSDQFSKPGLWTSLMYNEVGLSEEQMRLILSRKEFIHQERRALAQCQKLLKDTRDRILQHMQSLNRQMDILQNVLTPVQLAKFYVWVEKNEWCMQMLNSMWSAGADDP